MMEVEMQGTVCAECGVPFTLPKNKMDSLTKSSNIFYCPNGHHLNFGESENEKLKRQILDKDNEIQFQYDRNETLEKGNANLRGQITKLKNKEEKK